MKTYTLKDIDALEPWPQSCVCGGESFVAYFDEEGDHD